MTGVDISDAMLESARRRAKVCVASVERRQASARSLPVRLWHIRHVPVTTILCFIKDPVQVVQESAACYVRAGPSSFASSADSSLWAARRAPPRVARLLKVERCSFSWTFGGVRHLLQEAGFQVCAARGCVYYPPFNLAAHIVGEHDHVFSFLGQIGAGYPCGQRRQVLLDIATLVF